MDELKTVRNKINEIDASMAKLFEERMQACREIAGYKKEHGLSVRDSAREAELIDKRRKDLQDDAIEPYYVQFLKNTIDLSCRYQSMLLSGRKVTYCGVEGAFAQIAAHRMFPDAQLTAFPSFAEAYAAVESGEYDCAVLPLENSYAGEVGAVMDLIFSGTLYINQVMDLPIVHHLIAPEGASLEDIRTVVSHPQALDQCSGYIEKHGFETKTYSNTAAAAKYVKDLGDKTVAAIASEETCEKLGLKILESSINDSKNNTTRFAVFSRAQNHRSSAGRKDDENFMLVFTVKNEAGALAQTLNIIGAHGYNMRTLRSRPMKGLKWNYYFFIEAEGNIHNTNGQDMLQELSAICAKLKNVGSYSEIGG